MTIENARVLWSEGLFLRPHHFQQQERFLESLIDADFHRSVNDLGFHRADCRSRLLLKGKVALTRARGIFDDGTPFSVPSGTTALQPLVPEGTRDATFICMLNYTVLAQRLSAWNEQTGVPATRGLMQRCGTMWLVLIRRQISLAYCRLRLV
jgi:predicted component of type VI protein secretion system